MAQTNQQLSASIVAKITHMLNDEILKGGEIQINNKVIWDGMLHRMDNTVWRGCIELLLELNQQHGEMLTLQDLRNLEDALALLNRYDQHYDRVLDMKNRHVDAKKTAWRALMSMREIVCRCWAVDLPNSNTSRVLSNYGSLFE